MSRMGRPPRPRPDDFELAFVILGRQALEDYYGTNVTRTIGRWMGEVETLNLKASRATFVRVRKAMLGQRPQREPRIVGVSQMEAHRSASIVRKAFPHVVVEPVMGRSWQVGGIVISNAEMKALGVALSAVVSSIADEAGLGQNGVCS